MTTYLAYVSFNGGKKWYPIEDKDYMQITELMIETTTMSWDYNPGGILNSSNNLNQTFAATNGEDWMTIIDQISDYIATSTATLSNIITSTKIGSDIAYEISNSKILTEGSRLLKPLGYIAAFYGTYYDFQLAKNGEMSWEEFSLNTIVTASALAIGGWWGLGLVGLYEAEKMIYKGLEQDILKPNPNPTSNYIPGLAPTFVIPY